MQAVSKFNHHMLEEYQAVLGSEVMSDLRSVSKKLQGKKIYEINATSTGGGVAELLQAQMPLYADLGLDVHWLVLPPSEKFFSITKNLHNCLQGQCALPVKSELEQYKDYLVTASKDIPLDGDVYILHDPQTLGLAPPLKEKHLIWRCHIDITQAEPEILDWVQEYYQYFDKVIFSLKDYATGIDEDKVAIVCPAIDPLSVKNIDLTQSTIDSSLQRYSIDTTKPYLLQVSRFDKFKNPIGVIDIFEETKKLIPELQCVLAGDYATDDPEGKPYFEKVSEYAQKVDPQNIKIVTSANDEEINALQRGASAVIQNSTKEGFGLTVTEALWKERIVFSRPVGGISLQVLDGKTGYYLSNNNLVSARAIARVLNDPNEDIFVQAKEHVRKNFLLPKMVHDYLQVYSEVL